MKKFGIVLVGIQDVRCEMDMFGEGVFWDSNVVDKEI